MVNKALVVSINFVQKEMFIDDAFNIINKKDVIKLPHVENTQTQ